MLRVSPECIHEKQCVRHPRPEFVANPATGVSEELRPVGNTIPLLDGFRVSNFLI